MIQEKKIKYVKHPVSPEEKRKLIQEGYKIIDARFDPNPVKSEPVKPAKSKKADD